MAESAADRSASKAKRAQYIKYIQMGGAGVLAVLIFLAGWGIGSGRITYSTVKTLNPSVSGSPDYSQINDVYTKLLQNYDGKLSQQQLTDGMLSGLAAATGDPYTEYFNAKDAQAFNEQLSGTITGIGAQLGKSSDGYIEIIAPIDGSPAAAAGLRAKDIITKVGTESTSGWAVDKAVAKIRGDKGTSVDLTIVRAGQDEPFTVHITRDEITVPSVESSILAGNIGYMRISQFSDNTGDLAKAAAKKFTDAGVTKVILDLRDNPGGLVDQATMVASMWLPKNKLILQEKRGSTVVNSTYSSGSNPLLGLKTVVLINGGSASASEIVAGALKDNGAASLIGEKSYGKGVVQQVINLSGGAELKVTVASWWRPNGQNINKKGITPDKAVTMSSDDYAAGRDPQKDAAVKALQ